MVKIVQSLMPLPMACESRALYWSTHIAGARKLRERIFGIPRPSATGNKLA